MGSYPCLGDSWSLLKILRNIHPRIVIAFFHSHITLAADIYLAASPVPLFLFCLRSISPHLREMSPALPQTAILVQQGVIDVILTYLDTKSSRFEIWCKHSTRLKNVGKRLFLGTWWLIGIQAFNSVGLISMKFHLCLPSCMPAYPARNVGTLEAVHASRISSTEMVHHFF